MGKYFLLVLSCLLYFLSVSSANATNWTFKDNVTIQGNLNVEGSLSASAGSVSLDNLSVGSVTDTQIKYLGNARLNIQTQLDDKRGLDNGTFLVEVTAPRFTTNCNPAAGECGVNDMNTVSLSSSQFVAGKTWFDGTDNIRKQRNADNTVTLQLMSSSITQFQKCITIDNVVAASDYPVESFPVAITIIRAKVYQTGADNVIGQWDECVGTNGACSSSAVIDSADIIALDGVVAFDDGALSNPGIAAGNIVKWRTTSVGGTNTSAMLCFYYTMDTVKP